MKVRLVATTENLLDNIYNGARTCYKAGSPVEPEEHYVSKEDKIKLVQKILKSGHKSIAEHANFTFVIEGISRACSHQLVRHRHCSFSQQSQRYVKYDKPEFYYPIEIMKNEESAVLYNDFLEYAKGTYHKLVELGIKPEDARMVLPNATCSNITMTLNLRELIHICGLRLCSRAQLEIRQVVQQMAKEVIIKEEWTKSLLVPKCEHLGYCNEFNSCGRKQKA